MSQWMLIKIGCPRCADGLVTLCYYPGDPGVWNDGNGGGYPPEPAEIEDIQAMCQCWPPEEVTKVLSMEEDTATIHGMTLLLHHPVYASLMEIVDAYLNIRDFYKEEAAEIARAKREDDNGPLAAGHGEGW